MHHDPITHFQLAQQRHAADVRRAELGRLARSAPAHADRRRGLVRMFAWFVERTRSSLRIDTDVVVELGHTH